MKLTTYFIKHPVIAIIFNSLIVVTGLLCLQNLSVREYPQISFPVISVHTIYPNASPELVESVVTTTLEDQLAGIEGLDTMTSKSRSGRSMIQLNFRGGISMDKAYSAVQEAVGQARSLLPDKVISPIVERQRDSEGLPFVGIALESTSMGFGELTHYAHAHLKNALRNIKGVASVDVWGQPYTYSIQLDPRKLYTFGINVDEIYRALEGSRFSMPAGNFQNKIPASLDFELKSEVDYQNLLIKTVNKHPVYLQSVADVKLKEDDKQFRVRVNGHPGLLLSLQRGTDANPLEVSLLVQQAMQRIQENLPKEISATIIIDQAKFIQASMKNIKSSIIESILLVMIIVFLFLRNIRATLVPLIAIPISLLGSLLFLKALGFSINQMTLLAMVLAVGLVVDDAIIVLENIWRHREEGDSPVNAAIKGSKQIGFAIIAMTLTLASVYAPIAFIEGMLGQLFIEFAVALAGSVIISGVVALSLSPLMCSYLLKSNGMTLWPWIDNLLNGLSSRYKALLSRLLQQKTLVFTAMGAVLGLSFLLFKVIPAETAPAEDRGLVGIYTPLLSGDNLDSLQDKVSLIETVAKTVPEASNLLQFSGNWGASTILPLKPHEGRKRSAAEIVETIRPPLTQIPSLDAFPWSWDTGLPGIDNVGSGMELNLVVSTSEGFKELFRWIERLKQSFDSSHLFASVRYDFRMDSLGYSIKLDKDALARLGLTPEQVAKTIEVFFSGDKSITFQKDGVVYAITLEGKQSPWTLNELYLTNPEGQRISLGSVAVMKREAQPAALNHVNQMRSATVSIQLKDHDTLHNGMQNAWNLAKEKLPSQYQLGWDGAAKAYLENSQATVLLFLLSLIFIYAILAMQFEHFVYPLIILVTVPLACFGALVFIWLFGQTMNIFTQVGLVTLVGLITKHGILIIEFANQLRKQGVALKEAIITSCSLRLRPILMTTAAMVCGAVPLVLSHSAGAEARRAIGLVLIGGLTLGTLFTLFLLPMVYWLVVRKLRGS